MKLAFKDNTKTGFARYCPIFSRWAVKHDKKWDNEHETCIEMLRSKNYEEVQKAYAILKNAVNKKTNMKSAICPLIDLAKDEIKIGSINAMYLLGSMFGAKKSIMVVPLIAGYLVRRSDFWMNRKIADATEAIVETIKRTINRNFCLTSNMRPAGPNEVVNAMAQILMENGRPNYKENAVHVISIMAENGYDIRNAIPSLIRVGEQTGPGTDRLCKKATDLLDDLLDTIRYSRTTINSMLDEENKGLDSKLGYKTVYGNSGFLWRKKPKWLIEKTVDMLVDYEYADIKDIERYFNEEGGKLGAKIVNAAINRLIAAFSINLFLSESWYAERINYGYGLDRLTKHLKKQNGSVLAQLNDIVNADAYLEETEGNSIRFVTITDRISFILDIINANEAKL